MGEIKSTLDLVMERTRNMSLSADEKKDQEIETARKNFNGAVQKYLDHQLDLEALRRESADLQKRFPSVGAGDLSAVLLERIEPDSADGPQTGLLHALFDIEVDAIKRVGREYRAQVQAEAQLRTQELKQILAEDFRIAGSAVIPNLEADAQWREAARKLKAAFNSRLTSEKSRIVL